VTLPYKIGGGLLLLLATFLGGFLTGRGQVRTETVFQDRIVVQEKQVVVKEKAEVQTVVQWRDRIVTVTKVVERDGTTKETTTTEEKQQDKRQEEIATHNSTEKQTSTDTTHTEISKSAEPKYSVGVRFLPVGMAPLLGSTKDNFTITVGRRLLGPLYGDVGINGKKEVSIGFRIDL
jgi:hypothetical protein